MKIAFVRKYYTPYGGAERYLAQLIEQLCQQEHEVHVFANQWEETREEGGKKGRARAPFFHRVPVIQNPSFLEALTFALFSKRILQEESFDIIHSFERTLYQDIYRAGDGCHREWLIQRKKIDSWVKRISHPINPLHRSLLFLEKRLFQSPNLKRIIANSKKGKEEIVRHYKIKPEKIEVIYNGVDLDVFHPRNVARYRENLRKELQISPEALVLLFLGSGFRRKGLESLISALPHLKQIPHLCLLVAGKDSFSPYQEKAQRLGVKEKVIFLGSTLRAAELYASTDLFVLPTFYDPFSNACLEAMATGIPVLTTPQNGIAELIEDRQNGFLIQNPIDPMEISNTILSFYSSPLKTSLKERARSTSLNLGLDSAVQRMLCLYEEIKRG